ncbi:CARDB domain-containing protein [Natrinema sp. 74]|uniref:CARDB domain-containing protein n=1 Tax=Natrinema sp. 74 TaxID=3384159 RepID=UPI0038D4D407
MIRRKAFSSHVSYATVATVAAVVALVVSATVGVGVAGAVAPPESNGPDEYAVAQGGACWTVQPVGDGHRTVTEFYDYRTPNTSPSSYSYSSHGTTHLQSEDTSTLFLHDGSDGLSLVVVHGQYDGNTSGGAATMLFDGLPQDGEWVVEDDNYDGADDEFSHRNSSSRITWGWGENRTDGAAFNGGLDGEFSITIDPAFNDRADFRTYDGRVTDWQLLSATDGGHERTSLNMSDPVTIQSGGCTSHAVTKLDVSDSVAAGESVAVSATVENDGALAGNFTVPVTVDGESVDERAVNLEPGETTTVSATVSFNDTGTHIVGMGDTTTEVTVGDNDESGGGGSEMPGFDVTAAAVAALLAALVARRRLGS